MDATQTIRRLGAVPALDGLRGAAVLLVVGYHADAFWNGWTGPNFQALRPIGAFIGVDLFFVLSGFLLTAILFGRSERGAWVFDFYRRRARRLVPALLLGLVCFAAYTAAIGHWVPGDVLVGISFLTNWSWKWPELGPPFALGHLWSVAIEAQLYVVLPLIAMVTGPSARTRRVLILYGGLILLVVMNRYRLWHADFPGYVIYQRTDTRADGMLIGALAAQVWCRGLINPRSFRWLLPPLLVGVSWLAFNAQFAADWMVTFGYTLVAVGFALIVLITADGSATRWNALLCLRPLRWAGRVSYGVYLWHLPVFYFVSQRWTVDARLQFVLAVSVTVAGVLVSWFFVERRVITSPQKVPSGGRESPPRIEGAPVP